MHDWPQTQSSLRARYVVEIRKVSAGTQGFPRLFAVCGEGRLTALPDGAW
jgi:hypothetical protein